MHEFPIRCPNKVLRDCLQVADGISAGSGLVGVDAMYLKHRTSQKYGADTARRGKLGRSGDDDVPERAPLHERRAMVDDIRARRGAAAAEADEDDGGAGRWKRPLEAAEKDEFYAGAEAAARDRKAARREVYARPAPLPPSADAVEEGSRKIGRDIEKNRGLTPHRSRDKKNPRTANRDKFQKKTQRWKGAVPNAREQTAQYGGEATGVKGNISRSRRF